MTFHERLYTLGLVESTGADYTAYQLERPTRQWWQTFIECRPVGSPPLTWTLFSEAFLFIPCSIDRNRLRDQLTRLEYGSISLPKYETTFHELSRNATMILPLEMERVWCFCWGLRLPLWIATKSLAWAGRSFLDIVEHARTMEELYREAYMGSDKRALF